MDNNNHDFTARMSDGRFITDYSPNCELNRKLQNNMTSWQYRMFLTNMADSILESEHKLDEEEFGCSDCSKMFLFLKMNMNKNVMG